MELIRKLGRKLINDNLISYGIFLCPDCLKEVEKSLSNGYKQKSCGCIKGKKLKNNYINKIKDLYETNNYTQRELAIKFGVTRQIISDILNNKIWV